LSFQDNIHRTFDITHYYIIFGILIKFIISYKHQSPCNLILAHHTCCTWFYLLSKELRQQFASFICRTMPQFTMNDGIDFPQISRQNRSRSISSLNDDKTLIDFTDRKMTITSTTTTTLTPLTNEYKQLKKLNNDLTRITFSFIQDYLEKSSVPKTVLICLPRDIRRNHPKKCWLFDDSYVCSINDLNDSITEQTLLNNKKAAKEFILSTQIPIVNDKRRRRHTETNIRQSSSIKDPSDLDSQTSKDDLDINSTKILDSDTNDSSIFNWRSLWINLTCRTFTNKSNILALIHPVSPVIDNQNERLYWFEAIKLSDTWSDKDTTTLPSSFDYNEQASSRLINDNVLNREIYSLVAND
ncbi:unnamed protein product, partial [Didymodactylos carnosus]